MQLLKSFESSLILTLSGRAGKASLVATRAKKLARQLTNERGPSQKLDSKKAEGYVANVVLSPEHIIENLKFKFALKPFFSIPLIWHLQIGV